MATTTPNFGWTVPTSTDLVKDGATAIETLGDAIDASLGGAWTSYTPTWTGQITNPVINNGTIDAKYKQIGKTVYLRIDIAMGSTTTYGSGDWRLTLPVEAKDVYAVILNVMALDSGTAWYHGLGSTGFVGNTTQFVPVQSEGGSGMSAMTATNPMTWTINDVLTISGTYEAL